MRCIVTGGGHLPEFTGSEAIAFMCIVRPGCIVGPQQQFMYVKQLKWVK
jgi:cell division cycle 14